MFQSRSGRPEDPWLGPDVCDYLRQEAGGRPASRRALPHRLHLRSHRSALRPRHRGRRRVPRARPADGAGQRRQRSSALRRRDGRRGRSRRSNDTARPAAGDRQRCRTREVTNVLMQVRAWRMAGAVLAAGLALAQVRRRRSRPASCWLQPDAPSAQGVEAGSRSRPDRRRRAEGRASHARRRGRPGARSSSRKPARSAGLTCAAARRGRATPSC